jgi:hypothetical protein
MRFRFEPPLLNFATNNKMVAICPTAAVPENAHTVGPTGTAGLPGRANTR